MFKCFIPCFVREFLCPGQPHDGRDSVSLHADRCQGGHVHLPTENSINTYTILLF